MLSPYFSSRKQEYTFNISDTTSRGNGDREIEQTGLDSDGTVALETPLRHDPLFCYYFRKFLDLYQLLYALKPTLIQESLAGDPWRLLVAVTLLNKTTGKVAIPVFWDLMKRWPTPWVMSQACKEELRNFLYPLGTYNIRSQRLIAISKAYSMDPPSEHDVRPSRPTSPIKRYLSDRIPKRNERYPSTPISHLPGTGPYALDSYRIFCSSYDNPFDEEWKSVHPTDKELVLYLRWKWAYAERKEWSPLTGHPIPADIPYLESLVNDLTDYHMRQKNSS